MSTDARKILDDVRGRREPISVGQITVNVAPVLDEEAMSALVERITQRVRDAVQAAG